MVLLKVQTKSIYAPKADSDGTRVLVSRYYPRGVKRTHFDLWVRGASPEVKLLKAYKNREIDWDVFTKKFKEQLQTSVESKEAIEQIVELSEKNHAITLLCYEKEGENCHREIVKSLVDRKIHARSRKKRSATD